LNWQVKCAEKRKLMLRNNPFEEGMNWMKIQFEK